MQIGIPKSFAYINISNIFVDYIKELDPELKIKIIDKTNKEILDLGVKKTIEEVCLPFKIFVGYIEKLIENNIKIILTPRITALDKAKYSCPKIIGVVDFLKTQYPDIHFISPEINNYSNDNMFKFLIELGEYITNDKNKIKKVAAKYCRKSFRSNENIKKIENSLLLVGHEYLLYDNYIIEPSIKIIQESIFNFIRIYDVNIYNRQNFALPKGFFWESADSIINNLYYILANYNIVGIIYFMSFGCGIDSVLFEIIKNIAEVKNLPIINIVIDEHSGYIGYHTRIEAFLDMIEWRIMNENNISTYGKSLYSSERIV